MSQAARIDPETGNVVIDLAALEAMNIPPERILAFDKVMSQPILERLPRAQKAYERTAAGVSGLTNSGEPDLCIRLRDAAARAIVPVDPDENGFLMGTTMERMNAMKAEMTAFYDEVAGIAGSEEILKPLALDIQALFHPDTPFRPAADADPRP